MTRFFFFFIFFINILAAYDKPDHVDNWAWENVQPFLLPEGSHTEKTLHKIFGGKSNPLINLTTLKLAGFRVLSQNGTSGLAVLIHPDLKGKVIKVFAEDTKSPGEWYNYWRRAQGAQVISETIQRHGWGDHFFAPKKYIYPIPKANNQKCMFLLVAEQVKIPKKSKHRKMWKGKMITPEILTCLFILIKEAGMADSVFTDNIPLSTDGKISFIDTEHFHNPGIPFQRLKRYLSPKMQVHWQYLIDNPPI